MLKIRLATPADARGILEIYAPYIRNTSLTFEFEVPSEKDFTFRINKYSEEWPWLVCESNGMISGYAYASRYRERPGYQWSCECSVYIHESFMNRGIAQSLYAALFNILKRQGYRNVYAVINLPNDKSVALHEKCGFTWMATYKNVGYKLGKWKDVGWWVLQLNEYDDEPAAPVSINKMNQEFLPELFKEISKSIR